MIFEIGDREINVRFRYDGEHLLTSAVIDDESGVIGVGVSVCEDYDKFDKAAQRKLALGAAIVDSRARSCRSRKECISRDESKELFRQFRATLRQPGERVAKMWFRRLKAALLADQDVAKRIPVVTERGVANG